jgi:hypothetical protein
MYYIILRHEYDVTNDIARFSLVLARAAIIFARVEEEMLLLLCKYRAANGACEYCAAIVDRSAI